MDDLESHILSLTEAVNCGSELPTVEVAGCKWRYALIVVHARNASLVFNVRQSYCISYSYGLSVRHNAGIVSKLLNLSSYSLHCLVARDVRKPNFGSVSVFKNPN